MSLDVEAALKEALKMKDKEFAEYFVVDEVADNIEIALRKNSKGRPVWLERGTWIGVNNYVKDKDGKWDKKQSKWFISLRKIKQPTPTKQGMDSQATYKEPGNEIPTPSFPIPLEQPQQEISTATDIQDEAAYLKATYEKLGPLLPVFRTPSGEIIDGKHRLALDPGWFSMVLRGINDPVKLAMARLTVNVVRRKVPAEEKTELLGEIAKLTGWTPQQIADGLGMSYPWVMRYLPAEYKQEIKARAGRVGAEVSAISRIAKAQERKTMETIQRAPVEVQPRIREIVDRQKFSPEETEDLVGVIEEMPPEKWPEVLLTPRAAITQARTQKPKLPKKPKPLATGIPLECDECHVKLLLNHLEYPNGKIEHKLEKLG